MGWAVVHKRGVDAAEACTPSSDVESAEGHRAWSGVGLAVERRAFGLVLARIMGSQAAKTHRSHQKTPVIALLVSLAFPLL